MLTAAPGLQWLHQRGAGIDRIAHAQAGRQRRLVLTNGSGNHATEHRRARARPDARLRAPAAGAACGRSSERHWQPPTGEHAVRALGADARRDRLRRDRLPPLAERAAAFGMRVIGVRRSPAGASLAAGIRRDVPRPTRSTSALARGRPRRHHPAADRRDARPLLDRAPGGDEARRLSSTTSAAARIVDQAALLAALRSGHLAGAGLDVTDPEPLPADSPLWLEPGVLITAHSSGLTPRSYERYRALLLENMRRFAARRDAAQRRRQATRLLSACGPVLRGAGAAREGIFAGPRPVTFRSTPASKLILAVSPRHA